MSFLALGYGVLELILFRWWLAVVMFAASIVTAYVAYRLGGGRHNVTLQRGRWGTSSASNESTRWEPMDALGERATGLT